MKSCRIVGWMVVIGLLWCPQVMGECEGPVTQVGEFISVPAIADLIGFEFDTSNQPDLEIDCNSQGIEVTADPTQPLTMSFFCDADTMGFFEPFDFSQCPTLSIGPFSGNPFAGLGQGGAVTFTLSPAELQALMEMTDTFGGVLFGVESVACDLDAIVFPLFFYRPPSVALNKICLSGSQVFIGQPVRFELGIDHLAGGTAEGVVIADTLPIELSTSDLHIHSDIDGAGCTLNGRTITCQLGDLAPEFSGNIWITSRTLSEGMVTNSMLGTSTNGTVFNTTLASCNFEILDLNVSQCPELVLLEPGNSLRCASTLDPAILEVIPSGGTPPYSYLWLPPIDGGTTSSISVTPSQSSVFSVTVTDFLGCQVTKEVAVLVVTHAQASALWMQTGPEFLPDQNRDGSRDVRDLVAFLNGCP